MLEQNISDFVSMDSKKIFDTFNLTYDFIETDIQTWPEDVNFQECKRFFQNLSVVNDVAERGVALIEEYNKCLTKNEDDLQYLLLVINNHRKSFPKCNKQNLA